MSARARSRSRGPSSASRERRQTVPTPVVTHTEDIGAGSDHVAAPPTLGEGLENVGNEASASSGGEPSKLNLPPSAQQLAVEGDAGHIDMLTPQSPDTRVAEKGSGSAGKATGHATDSDTSSDSDSSEDELDPRSLPDPAYLTSAGITHAFNRLGLDDAKGSVEERRVALRAAIKMAVKIYKQALKA